MAGKYGVKFVADDALPEGQDWVLVMVDGDTFFVVKESRVTTEALEEGWTAYRQFAPEPVVPTSRKSGLLLQMA